MTEKSNKGNVSDHAVEHRENIDKMFIISAYFINDPIKLVQKQSTNAKRTFRVSSAVISKGGKIS